MKDSEIILAFEEFVKNSKKILRPLYCLIWKKVKLVLGLHIQNKNLEKPADKIEGFRQNPWSIQVLLIKFEVG